MTGPPPSIKLSSLNFGRIETLLDCLPPNGFPEADLLAVELDRARILDPLGCRLQAHVGCRGGGAGRLVFRDARVPKQTRWACSPGNAKWRMGTGRLTAACCA